MCSRLETWPIEPTSDTALDRYEHAGWNLLACLERT
jgi:hypothetical protein